jgi:hypothetical protein
VRGVRAPRMAALRGNVSGSLAARPHRHHSTAFQIARQSERAPRHGVRRRKQHRVGGVDVPAGYRAARMADHGRDRRFAVAHIGRQRCERVPERVRRNVGWKARQFGNALPKFWIAGHVAVASRAGRILLGVLKGFIGRNFRRDIIPDALDNVITIREQRPELVVEIL